MGKPCCDCGGDACPSGRLCVSTFNPYSGAPISAIMTMLPYGSGETPRCINVTFADVSFPYEFNLSGENMCAARDISIEPSQFLPCEILNTGIPLCRTRFYWEGSSEDMPDPCNPPTIAGIITCPDGTGGNNVLGDGQSIGYYDAYINGSSITCPLGGPLPDGTVKIQSCMDEPYIGLVNFSGKTLGYQNLKDWECICGDFDCGVIGDYKFYKKTCVETELTHCTDINVTVPEELVYECDELWELECTKDASRRDYNGCCPDPITWTDSRFKVYSEDEGCICSDYVSKGPPCFTADDYHLVFNGSVPFSGYCSDYFGQFGLCGPIGYNFTIDGPIPLNNTGPSGSHTNTWWSPNACCSDFVTPYWLTLTVCPTQLTVQACGKGIQGFGPGGLCLCPVLECPAIDDFAFTQTLVFSGLVMSCNPIDIEFYDSNGDSIGSVTQ